MGRHPVSTPQEKTTPSPKMMNGSESWSTSVPWNCLVPLNRHWSPALGDAFPIFGGTAGDQWRFKGTKQFHGAEVLQDSVSFLIFDEGVVFSFGVDTGWRPIGREGRVTEVDGHVVRAIDGRPA